MKGSEAAQKWGLSPTAAVLHGGADEILEHRQQKFAGSPAEAAGLFHPDAESIHPFAGSGRTGRPLMDLELMQSGYPTIDGKFTDRRRYYDAYCRSGGAEAKTLLAAKYVDERLGQYPAILQ